MSAFGYGSSYQAPQPMGSGARGTTNSQQWATTEPRDWTMPAPAEVINPQAGQADFYTYSPTSPLGIALQQSYGQNLPNVFGAGAGRAAMNITPDQLSNIFSRMSNDQIRQFDLGYDRFANTMSQANQFYVDAYNAGDPYLTGNLQKDQSNLRAAMGAYERRASALGLL